MKSEQVLSVEGLGKRYVLSHQAKSGSLRDSLTQGIRGLFRRSPSVTQDEFWALRDVSFTVNQGDVVGIIGRNGAGKSTLLKILSRITEPTSGRAVIRGRVASLLEVGTGFHPELTGRENIFLNGAILGMNRAEIARKFDEIVAFAEVERFLDTQVKHYSSGMYVRLAFAVAAHLEPEILIIDEVLAVGDASFQRKCLGRIQQATREEGRTVLFVSHNLAAVRQLCTRTIVLQAGRIVADAPPAEALTHYIQLAPRQGAASYRHIAGDGRARITGIDFHAPVGAEPIFAIFEPIRLRLRSQIMPGTGPLEFFFLIHSEDGECVAASFQRDTSDFYQPVGTDGVINITFKNPFAPGRYLLSAGIFDSSRQFLDWVEFAEGFQVLSGFHDGRAFDNRLGRITLLPEWTT